MERSVRSMIKAVSWRVVATATTFTIVFVLTGQLLLAVEVGVLEVVAKLVLYYLHERVWDTIGWGKDYGLIDNIRDHDFGPEREPT